MGHHEDCSLLSDSYVVHLRLTNHEDRAVCVGGGGRGMGGWGWIPGGRKIHVGQKLAFVGFQDMEHLTMSLARMLEREKVSGLHSAKVLETVYVF